jgi:hypothetical protein
MIPSLVYVLGALFTIAIVVFGEYRVQCKPDVTTIVIAGTLWPIILLFAAALYLYVAAQDLDFL